MHCELGEYELSYHDSENSLWMRMKGEKDIQKWKNVISTPLVDKESGHVSWTQYLSDRHAYLVHFMTEDNLYAFVCDHPIEAIAKNRVYDVDSVEYWVPMGLVLDPQEIYELKKTVNWEDVKIPLQQHVEYHGGNYGEEEIRAFVKENDADIREYMQEEEHYKQHVFFADDHSSVLAGFIRPDPCEPGKWKFTDGGTCLHEYVGLGGVAIMYRHATDEIWFRDVSAEDMVHLYREVATTLDGIHLFDVSKVW